MKNKRNCWFQAKNIYIFLLYKALWIFLALILTQLLFVCYNQWIFHLDTLEDWLGLIGGNTLFCIVTTATLMLPYVIMMLLPIKAREKRWYQITAESILLLVVLISLIANISDCAYFQFTYRRISSDIFAYLTIGGQMGSLIPHFLVDYWPVSIFGTLIIVLYLLCSFKTQLAPSCNPHTSGVKGFVIGMILMAILVRGGIIHPLQLSDAARFAQIKNSALITNSPLSVIRTSLQPHLHRPEKVVKTNPPVYQFKQESAYMYYPCAWKAGSGAMTDSAGHTTYSNIVVIVLESFSQEYMGCYGAEVSYTPFLDSLYQLGYCYDGRSNGKKSIEGIPSVFASLPTLMETPIVLSSYRNNEIDGLPKALRMKGYQTAFFHGGYNGTMDFDRMTIDMGFESYYGMNEYVAVHGDKDYDHAWGIYDEPFLQFAADEISKMQEPFMVGMFTLSSHHPYSVAPGYEGKLKQGEHPLLQVVNYSDNALRQFFKRCSREPWFNNTLFVITADHPGQGLSAKFNNHEGWYKIPLIFYCPGHHAEGQTDEDCCFGNQGRMMQQIDIMPTILDYVHFNEDTPVCFGQSIFQSPTSWNVVYGNGFHTIVMEDENDPSIHHVASIEGQFTEGEEAYLNLLSSFVNRYNDCMTNNKTSRFKNSKLFKKILDKRQQKGNRKK